MTSSKLQEILSYDPATGIFRWRITVARKAKAGDAAGHCGSDGYSRIKIEGKMYLAHRLAWLYVNGDFPENQLDHINLIKNDNRIRNLRPASYPQNGANAKSRREGRLKGAFWDKDNAMWYSQIRENGIKRHLGRFKNEIDAHMAYMASAIRVYGEFARS